MGVSPIAYTLVAMARCKTPGRKRPKRAPVDSKRQDLDDDLVQLASVIAEFQLDNNVHGWFRPPWRDGWAAIALAMVAWERTCTEGPLTFERGIARYLLTLLEERAISNDAYLQATDDITALTLHGETESRKLLIGALRCYQLLAANSSGGGENYNDVLKKAFENVVDIEMVAELVLEWRCVDAIGVSPSLRQDANDRLRRAFTTAWRRGLYLAAYSLPPATDFSVKPHIVKG